MAGEILTRLCRENSCAGNEHFLRELPLVRVSLFCPWVSHDTATGVMRDHIG